MSRKSSQNTSSCVLCQRDLPLTFHHVIPRFVHKKRWVKKAFTAEQLQEGLWMCRPCHSAIHRFIGHADLARQYRTVADLLGHEQVHRYVLWSRKQRRSIK